MESLPSELHYEITKYLAGLRAPAVQLGWRSKPLFHFSPYLRKLSHVSGYWRSVALQFLLESIAIDGASNKILNYFIVTYRPHLRACKGIKVNLFPHSKPVLSKLYIEWAGGRLSKRQEKASRINADRTTGLLGLDVSHTPGGVFIATDEADAEHRQFWAAVGHGHYGPWAQRRMDLLAELLQETTALESLTIRCLPRRMLEDLYIQNILTALKGRQVPSLHLEGAIPATVQQLILECQPKQLHIAFSVQPPNEGLFPAMITNMSCNHIQISSESCFCKVHFPIPLNQALAPIRILSLTTHTYFDHLFQLLNLISSTLEELSLSGRIDLVPTPQSVHLRRLRILRLESIHDTLLLSYFRGCSNIQDITIGEVIPSVPDIGQLRSALGTGFVGLQCLTLRTGSAYTQFWGDEEDTAQLRSDVVPLEEDMKSRNVGFRLEL